MKKLRIYLDQTSGLLAPARNQLRALSKDARTIERVKKAHGHKPRLPWSCVKHELGLD